MTRNSKFWLVVAVVFDALGLFISFLGVLAIGAGVSGSGCGQQCSANSEMFLAIGIFLLVAALISAVGSIHLAKTEKGRGVIMVLGVLAALVASLPLLVFCMVL